MNRVLIISPYFPPTNAADMQRVRMSLPFFKEFGWQAEVVTVGLPYIDMVTDPLLLQSVPADTVIHYVGALPQKWTSKFGLGNVGLRSLFHYGQKVNQLLKKNHYDLIYFSTTQFAVCILGLYWKRNFGIPYVIDMQDPWHSKYYHDKPKKERPPKYWLAYRLAKKLEPVAMKGVGGLISVSESYLADLFARYPHCRTVPRRTIPFGAFENDFTIARQNISKQPSVLPVLKDRINIVYVGRGGQDMQYAVSILFRAFKNCLEREEKKFEKIHFYFIGTSYAPAGRGMPTIAPVARQIGIADYVTEITDRVPFYQTLNTLTSASALFVPGSTDAQYTASKIYPYVLAQKPLLALFHPNSSVVHFLKRCGVGTVATFDQDHMTIESEVTNFFINLIQKCNLPIEINRKILKEFSAEIMTKKQCELFEEVLSAKVDGDSTSTTNT